MAKLSTLNDTTGKVNDPDWLSYMDGLVKPESGLFTLYDQLTYDPMCLVIGDSVVFGHRQFSCTTACGWQQL
jgi:hypothetical protein